MIKNKNFRSKSGPGSISKPPQKKQILSEGVFVVEGLAAVQEYCRFRHEAIQKIFAKEKSYQSIKQNEIISKVRIPIEQVRETQPSEGDIFATPVWAHVKHELMTIDVFEKILQKKYSKAGTILALDHLSDPRNLGAIVRSAAFFGVSHIIVPERRQVLLTQSAVNTAQGGFALTDLVVVVNLSRALETLKSNGFWVLGADMDGLSASELRNKYEKQVIVLGSEDKGISPGVMNHCDVKVAIQGATPRLESLNVSVAAGILLHSLAL
jgi:predicted rRNA methylase